MAIINNPQDQSRRQGSGFTNLQRVMQANTGNRLGQAVGQGIQQAGQQTKQGLGQAQEQFKQEAEAGRLDTQQNKEKVENVLGDVGKATEGDISQFAKFRSGQYGGPQNLQNIENLKGQAAEAQQLGQAAGSQAGRTGLLQRFAATPGQYGAGQQRLDTMLLGASGAQPLREARRSVSGIGQKVAGAGEAAQGVAQRYQNLARGFGQDVTQRTTGMATEAQNAAEQRAQAANTANQTMEQQFQNEQQLAQSQNQLSAQALQSLGLDPNSADTRTFGVNLGQFMGYTPQNTQATALNVMQQPEFQKYTNLQKLMGQTPAEAPQAQYQAGQQTFNKEGLQGAIAEARKPWDELQAVRAPVEDQYKQALSRWGYAESSPVQNMNPFARSQIEPLARQIAQLRLASTQLQSKLAGNYSVTPPSDLENTPKVT